MIGGKAVSKRETVTASDHDAIASARDRSLPETCFDSSVQIVRRIIELERGEEVCGQRDAQPVAREIATRADIERPAI